MIFRKYTLKSIRYTRKINDILSRQTTLSTIYFPRVTLLQIKLRVMRYRYVTRT